MKRKYVASALAQLAGMSLFASAGWAAEAQAVKLGGFELIPALQLGEAYNDNIFAQESVKKGSWITTVQPAVKLRADDGKTSYELGYRYQRGIYHASTTDNYSDHFANADVKLKMSTHLDAGVHASYAKTHDARGTTFTGAPLVFNTPDKYHETVVGANVGYGVNARVDFSGKHSEKRYDNHRAVTQARDLNTDALTGKFSYPIAPKTFGVLEARYKRLNYKYQTATINLDSNEQRYFAGLDWIATAKTSGSLRVGYLRKNFSKANLTNGSTFSWELGMVWEPLTYSKWSLETSSTMLESDGTGNFIKSKGGSLSWQHEWNDRLSHEFNFGYRHNTFSGTAVARKDKVTDAGISMNYELLRWLTVKPGYKFTNRNSNAVLSSYRQNIWTLDFLATL